MKTVLPAAAMALLAGCAQPGGGPAPQAAPPTSAPVAAAASPAPAGPGRRATTCQVAGFSWQQRDAQVTPTMTVSSNGYCNVGGRNYGSTAQSMDVVAQPQHGRVVTSGEGMTVFLRYYPTRGYEGPDSFTVKTGSGGRVTASFAVTVIK